MKKQIPLAKLTGFAVYAGYKPTTQEIRAKIDGPVRVKIVQTSRWTHEARFTDSGVTIKTNYGDPIRGPISRVIAQLADRFERVVEYPVWKTKTGELAGLQPTDKPPRMTRATERTAKAYAKAEGKRKP
jgi:hypothetical protein